MAERLVLRSGVGAGGEPLELAISVATGTVEAAAPVVEARPGDVEEDCSGLVLLAAPVDPHAHLDKVWASDVDPGVADDDGSDLGSAIASWTRTLAGLAPDDVVARATGALETMVAAGTTAVRTHVGVGGADPGLVALSALSQVADDFARRGLLDLQIVAMLPCDLDAGGTRQLVDAVVAGGATVLGGCPYRAADPPADARLLVEAAHARGLAVDAHTDETLHADVLTVTDLAALAVELGTGAGITASHCVSLGVQDPSRQKDVAAELAGAGVAVVTLPQTNLYLQARGITTAAPRGLTALRPLLDAGVTVAGGADNVRDPFCRLGRLDPVETASLLVLAGHLSPTEAWTACTASARRAMGLPDAGISPGQPAAVLAIEGRDLTTAMAAASARRTVVRGGRVVARTTVARVLGG